MSDRNTVSKVEPDVDASALSSAWTGEWHQGRRLEVQYTLRLADLLSMYLGSWAARIAAAPGVICLLLLLVGWPPPADVPVASYLGMAVVAAMGAAGGPLLLIYMLFVRYQARSLVGTKIRLSIDDAGLWGWPLASQIDRSWPRVRRARRFRGVITLPFREFGTRAGWVQVPERALTAKQLAEFRGLLASKGLMKVGKERGL